MNCANLYQSTDNLQFVPFLQLVDIIIEQGFCALSSHTYRSAALRNLTDFFRDFKEKIRHKGFCIQQPMI